MTPRFLNTSLLLMLCTACWFAATTEVTFASQVEGERRVQLKQVESSVLLQADEYLSAGQWESGIEILMGFVEQDSNLLVKVESQSLQNGAIELYVPAEEFAQLVALRYASESDEFLQQLRARIGNQVERVDETLAPYPSYQQLARIDKDILERAFLSENAEEALLRSCAREIEAARFFEAKRFLIRLMEPETLIFSSEAAVPWQLRGSEFQLPEHLPQLLRTVAAVAESETNRLEDLTWPFEVSKRTGDLRISYSPAANAPRATILAYWIWVSIQQQDWELARFGIEYLAVRYPQSEGELMGETGDLVSILRTQLKKAEQDAEPSGDDRAERSIASDPAWQLDLIPDDSTPTGSQFFDAFPNIEWTQPKLIGDKVVWADRYRVRVIDVKTGEAYWKLGDAIDQDRLWKGMIWGSSSLTEERTTETGFLPLQPVSANGTSLVASVYRWDELDRNSTSLELVGFDIEGNGTLLSGFPIDPLSRTAEFEGAPLVSGNRLYSLMRTGTNQADSFYRELICLNLTHGASGGSAGDDASRWIRWRIPMGSGEELGEFRTASAQQIQLDEKSLYVVTNTGLICSIDAERGKIRWAVTYPRLATSNGRTEDSSPTTRCLITNDRVYAAPVDSGSIFCLDRSTGTLIWASEQGRSTDLLTTTSQYLIVGGEQLTWISFIDGRAVANFPNAVKQAVPRGSYASPAGVGTAAIVDDAILWPTRDSIYALRLEPERIIGADGNAWFVPSVLDQIDLRERSVQGGNLLTSEDYLIISGRKHLTAFPWLKAATNN